MVGKIKKLHIQKPVRKLLLSVPEKSREVLARRFGIGYNKAETLESIGASYNITRERVRQIQEYGLKKLIANGAQKELAPIFEGVRDFIRGKGGVAREADIFEELVSAQERPHFAFSLRLMPDLVSAPETDSLYTRYAIDNKAHKSADVFVDNMHRRLSERNAPISFSDLLAFARKECENCSGTFGDSLEHTLRLSKRIKEGPFGEYGLSEWPAIRPRGVRDKAHLVFAKEKRPLHFREISSLIDGYFVAKDTARKTNPQTVHNELIKDPRFVLIGRGLYALSEWGYNPGTVKDVLVQILKEANRPLAQGEVLDLVSQRRFVRPNTVFLNLQNKSYFKKLEGGKYYLA